MPDEAVMDAAVDTAIDDQGVDSTSEVSESTGDVQQDQHADAGGDQVDKITTPELKLIDGGKLSADTKKHLEELKTTNPPLAKALQRALYRGAEIDKVLPGGIKEVQQLRQTIETLGGEHGIKEMQAEVNGFRDFDKHYTAGDPKALEFMTSDPEGREAFLKLIPTALQKYEELHPEGFSNYMAQVIGGTMAQHGIPLALERLSDFIGDNPKAIEQFNKLVGFTKFINDLSSKQVVAPKFQQAQPDNRMGDLEQRETALMRKEWQAETRSEAQQIAKGELDRLMNGRKLTDAQTAHILETFELKMNAVVQQKHKDTFDRYAAAKDGEGFKRYASQVSKTEIPRVLRGIFEAALPAKPGPRPSNGVAPVKNGIPAKGVPIAAGFTQVAARPDYKTEVDLRNTFNNAENMRKGLAVLKDGKKVRWAVDSLS